MDNKHQDIKKELEQVAPFLSKIKQRKEQTPPPSDYFDRFEGRLIHRIQEEDALSERAPSDKPQQEAKSWWAWLFRPQWTLGIVGVIALVIVFSQFLRPSSVQELPSPDQLLAALTIEEAEQYIDTHIEDFSAEEITQNLAPDALPETPVIETASVSENGENENAISIEEVSDEELIEALDETDLDELESLLLEEEK